jgi:transcriptional regulator with GAF, ATPase, and Fis domain
VGVEAVTVPIDRSQGLLRLDQSTGTLKARQYVVRVTKGPDAGAQLSLTGTLTVGTHPDAGLRLTDPTVSRYHAELTARGDGVRVRDLGSKNGVLLSGVKVQELLVEADASLTVGRSTLHITFAEEDLGQPEGSSAFGQVIGASEPMRRLLGTLQRVALSDSTVLLLGESGTGKEVLAESIHQASPRRNRRLVVFDCAAQNDELIESQLLGHVKGAFTGAVADRRGAALEADGGTLFLDEIGELSSAMQPKLLRLLEAQTVHRLGEDLSHSVDVRVVAATHRDLEAEVKAGRFRLDLFYRLAVVMVRVPPLRDRPGDLPLLVSHFVAELGRPGFELPSALQEALTAYHWPGNVRELRNVVERSLAGQAFEPLTSGPKDVGEDALKELPFKLAKEKLVEAFTRDYFTELFRRHGGNVSKTASAAGIARTHAHKLIAQLGLKAGEGDT